ncbi:unnamed protein product [Polarella glacialis]|uniref:Uncharacterized protein n=1 Tax=Polarella glacialis TaxID=89957 RepID=A0A813F483_POLGL|nr:unnamed protein product [Polarella glacialis]
MSPWDRYPVAPVVVVAAGETLCLTLQEFVPHPGYYYYYSGITLVDKAVGPDDPEPVDWVVLMNKTAQTTDSTTTATKAFSVVIPLGKEAEHATIQVKQWAEDFSWYYYACTDIKIVATAAEVPANADTCWDRAAEQCVVTDERKGILQMVVYGVWAIGLVAALVVVWSIVVSRSSGGMARRVTAEGDVESKESQ